MGLTRAVAALLGALCLSGCQDAWRTPDQRGRALYKSRAFEQAAEQFRDPMWRGLAWFAHKDFERAASEFEGVPTADGAYDLGVCRALLGRYEDAIEAFDQAVALDSSHADARFNRDLVAKVLAYRDREQEGPDTDYMHFAPDEVRFDEKGERGQEGKVDETVLTPDQSGELWLRQIRTTPAAFLKRKFEIQARAK